VCAPTTSRIFFATASKKLSFWDRSNPSFPLAFPLLFFFFSPGRACPSPGTLRRSFVFFFLTLVKACGPFPWAWFSCPRLVHRAPPPKQTGDPPWYTPSQFLHPSPFFFSPCVAQGPFPFTLPPVARARSCGMPTPTGQVKRVFPWRPWTFLRCDQSAFFLLSRPPFLCLCLFFISRNLLLWVPLNSDNLFLQPLCLSCFHGFFVLGLLSLFPRTGPLPRRSPGCRMFHFPMDISFSLPLSVPPPSFPCL